MQIFYCGPLGQTIRDKSGKMVIEPIFDGVESFSEGFAAVRIGDTVTREALSKK